MAQRLPVILSVLFSLNLLACTGQDDDVPSKDEVRDSSSDERADQFGSDLCETFGWYNDDECDTFCANPDPDCICEESDCGVQPDFQPRTCFDGTLIFPNLTCEADGNGGCGWNVEAQECPVSCAPGSEALPGNAACSADAGVFGPFPSSCGGCPAGFEYGGEDCGQCEPVVIATCAPGSEALPSNAACSADAGVFGPFPSSCGGCPAGFEYGGEDCGQCEPAATCAPGSEALPGNAACSADAGVFGPFPSSCGGCPTGFEYGGQNCGQCEPL